MSKTAFENSVVKPETTLRIGEIDHKLISTEDEVSLDTAIKQVEEFMSKNSGEGLTEEEKDELYAKAQSLYKDYYKLVRDNRYSFYLNRRQYQFLTDLILTKLEYDVNSIFIAIELTEMLSSMKDTKFRNDDEVISFQITATEMTYIYHLISTHKVKGLTNTSYTFSQVLVRIGDLSKVINYYDTYAKNLNTEIQKWAVSLGGELEIPTE
jgi:hypothetical protein